MKQLHESRVIAITGSIASGLSDRLVTDLSRQIDDESIDFAIVVTLRTELSAVRKFFPELVKVAKGSTSGRSYYHGTIPTKQGGSYRVVSTLLHAMGNLDAAHATSDLIREWNPRFVLVNGIAGGLSRERQDFGDIVASDSVVYYEIAKIRPSDLDRRSRHFPADPSLLDGVVNLSSSAWRRRLPPRPDGAMSSNVIPRIHIGSIASSDNVIATIEAIRDLQSTQANLIAVEMDSAGVASAAFSAVKKVGFLTIRAICDFADAAKYDNWHVYAAESAASYLRDLVESHPVPLSEGTWPMATAPVEVKGGQVALTQRKKLFDQLCVAYDMEEFKNLCFLLNVDIDDLPGDRKSARIRELILLFERRKSLVILEEAVNEYADNEII
ncbi:MAG: hypothetical protein ACH37Z_12905 [Anaerolineae bacterium]